MRSSEEAIPLGAPEEKMLVSIGKREPAMTGWLHPNRPRGTIKARDKHRSRPPQRCIDMRGYPILRVMLGLHGTLTRHGCPGIH